MGYLNTPVKMYQLNYNVNLNVTVACRNLF